MEQKTSIIEEKSILKKSNEGFEVKLDQDKAVYLKN